MYRSTKPWNRRGTPSPRAWHRHRGGRLAAAALLLTGAVAHARDLPSCELDGVKGRVAILANDFETTNVLARAIKSCAHDGLEIETNLNTEVRDIQVAALSAKPAAYTSVMTANGSVVPLLNDNLIRPLNSLVDQYGSTVTERQKITIGGDVMAIAFMANAQHFMYRQDVLDQLGLEVPTTWDEVIEAAEATRAAGIMANPIAGTYKTGFNLGLEFIDHYLALGGSLFEGETAAPALVNDTAIAALERMKRITTYMDPDFLTMDTKVLVAEMEQGTAAFANVWGSSAGAVIDGEGAAPGVVEQLRLAAAPLVGEPGKPAATLWWDGFTIARNIDDADAAATFRTLVASTGTDVANAFPESATWLAEGYVPVPTDAGVFATIDAGAAPYPVLPWMSLMNVALGTELVDFFQGRESAEKALRDVEASYRTQAGAAGFR